MASCMMHPPALALLVGMLTVFPLLGIGAPMLAFRLWPRPLRREIRVVVVFAVSLALFLLVLPEIHVRFLRLFDGMDFRMPPWTRAALAVGYTVTSYRWLIAVSGLVVVVRTTEHPDDQWPRVACVIAIALMHLLVPFIIGGYAWLICDLSRIAT